MDAQDDYLGKLLALHHREIIERDAQIVILQKILLEVLGYQPRPDTKGNLRLG